VFLLVWIFKSWKPWNFQKIWNFSNNKFSPKIFENLKFLQDFLWKFSRFFFGNFQVFQIFWKLSSFWGFFFWKFSRFFWKILNFSRFFDIFLLILQLFQYLFVNFIQDFFFNFFQDLLKSSFYVLKIYENFHFVFKKFRCFS